MFMYAELDRFLPLLDVEKIQFQNYIQVIPKETLAVLLIKLSILNCF